MKQGVVLGLAMVAGGLGSSGYEYLRSLGEPEALANAAPAPKPAPPAPTVIVREIVREVRAEPERSRDEEALAEDEVGPADVEETAEEQKEREGAELEAGFEAAPVADRSAVEAEAVLVESFNRPGVLGSRIECRAEHCRITATFADATVSSRTLHEIFASGPNDSLPNLASTVTARKTRDDGSVEVTLHLHPD